MNVRIELFVLCGIEVFRSLSFALLPNIVVHITACQLLPGTCSLADLIDLIRLVALYVQISTERLPIATA